MEANLEEIKRPDLGQGNVSKLFRNLAIPTVVAQIVNLLYNVVDRMYIGHIPGVGSAALTGVGLFVPILTLINAFAMLAGAGGAPRAAMAMGAKDKDVAEKIMGNCLCLLLLLAVVLTIVFYVLAEPMLIWFGASEATLPYALEYSQIYILGTLVVLLVMGLNPFITTQGFTKIGMLTVVIGAVINIILDPIFIYVFNWGVRGAAIATVLSQCVGALWVFLFLIGKRTMIRLRTRTLRIEAKILGPCLALGSSTFVMLSTESVLSISFISSLARYGGDLAVGAMTIITSVAQMVSLPLTGVCQGGQPIMSFNYGAGKPERVREAFKIQLITCAVYAGIFWALIMLLPRAFALTFTDDEQLAQYTAWALRVYGAGIFAMGFQMACQQSFVALSQAKISLFLACLRKLILLIPLIYILPLFIPDQVFAVYLAEPVSDITAATVTVGVFMHRFKRILGEVPHGI